MSSIGRKVNILFLCTGNSCRSQMAEGWARHLLSEACVAYSAGIESHGLNPSAVAVMAEAGVDISNHLSRTVAELPKVAFDIVITVCDAARESCPFYPGVSLTMHHSFDDPPRLAAGLDGDEALAVYRRVRDDIRDFVMGLPTYFPTVVAESV